MPYSSQEFSLESVSAVSRPQDQRFYPIAKRGLDILGACAFLLVFSPLLLLIALAVKMGDGGPILFRQTRIGKDGKPFVFLKFRSMVPQAEALRRELIAANHHGAQGVTFKIPDDPRVTQVGRYLRRYSLDELPQFLCVLKGEMSLVGPRPALPVEVERYNAYERQRLAVKPGLTCIWQVSGRANIPFDEQVQMDLEYIQTRSLRTDMALLARTLPAIFSGHGAY